MHACMHSLMHYLSSVSYNNIGDKGLKELGTALAINKSLQGFSLWRNSITSEGARYLAEGLRNNSTLKWLGVSSHCWYALVVILSI